MRRRGRIRPSRETHSAAIAETAEPDIGIEPRPVINRIAGRSLAGLGAFPLQRSRVIEDRLAVPSPRGRKATNWPATPLLSDELQIST